MAVRTTPESQFPDFPGSFDGPPEVCVVCRAAFTRHWWGGGCCPLCPSCAAEVSHASMVALCERDGWGPVPTENTDVERTSP